MMYGLAFGMLLPALCICLAVGFLVALAVGGLCGYAIANKTQKGGPAKDYERV